MGLITDFREGRSDSDTQQPAPSALLPRDPLTVSLDKPALPAAADRASTGMIAAVQAGATPAEAASNIPRDLGALASKANDFVQRLNPASGFGVISETAKAARDAGIRAYQERPDDPFARKVGAFGRGVVTGATLPDSQLGEAARDAMFDVYHGAMGTRPELGATKTPSPSIPSTGGGLDPATQAGAGGMGYAQNSIGTQPVSAQGPISAAAQSTKPYDVASQATATSPEVRTITNATLYRAYGGTRQAEQPVIKPVMATPGDDATSRSIAMLNRELMDALKPTKSNDDYFAQPIPPDYAKAALIAGAISHLKGSLSTDTQAEATRAHFAAQSPLYAAQSDQARARAAREGAQAGSLIADEARKSQLLALQRQFAAETDPGKRRVLQAQIAAFGVKSDPRFQVVTNKSVDSNGMPNEQQYILSTDEHGQPVVRDLTSLVPIRQNPKAMAIANDPKLSRDEKEKQLRAMGYQ